MTVNSTIIKSGPYVGNGVTTVFARDFLAFEPEHVRVFQVAEPENIEMAYGFTHTGIGEPVGTVEFVVPPDPGFRFIIQRVVPNLQRSDYSNQATVEPERIEEDLDLLTMQAQQAQQSLDVLNADYARLNQSILSAEMSADRAEAALAAMSQVNHFIDIAQADGVTTAFTLSAPPSSREALHVTFNGLTQHSDVIFEIEDLVVTFAEAPPDGVEIQFRYTSFDPNSAVSFDGNIVSVRKFGAKGDGSSDDGEALRAAVAYCARTGDALHWPAGEFVAPASIPLFHEVAHFGDGVIVRGGTRWHITPRASDLNALHVSPLGDDTLDGLSASAPMASPQLAFTRLKALAGVKPFGVWRVQFAAGTWTTAGTIRLDGMPFTMNRIEVFGAPVSGGTPLTEIDASAVSGAGIGAQWDGRQFFHFRDLSIRGAGTYGIQCWGDCMVFVENVHVRDCGDGMGFRDGRASVSYGAVTDCGVGISMQGQVNGDIGDIGQPGSGVAISGCSTSVQFGRGAKGYLRYSDLTDAANEHLYVTRNARCRIQGNSFGHSDGRAMLRSDRLGNIDVDQNVANSYPGARFGQAVFLVDDCSVIGDVHQGTPAIMNNCYLGAPVTITGTARQNIADGTPELAPFRLPGNFMFNPRATLILEMEVEIEAGNAPSFELAGRGASVADTIADISTGPTHSENRFARITMKSHGARAGGTDGYSWAEMVFHTGPTVHRVKRDSIIDWSRPALSENSAEILPWRLYVTNTAGWTKIVGFRSYVEY